MPLKQNFQLLAEYNRWMNANLYEVVSSLGDDEIIKDRGAFFGSILGTLNHLMVGDIAWMHRFKRHPSAFSTLSQMDELPIPLSIDHVLFSEFPALHAARKTIDSVFVDLCAEIEEQDMDMLVAFKTTKGEKMSMPFSALLQHLFNHQTHHRGQVTTLLSQMGVDFGVTDLVAIVKNECQIKATTP